jgi:hypothetical protein
MLNCPKGWKHQLAKSLLKFSCGAMIPDEIISLKDSSWDDNIPVETISAMIILIFRVTQDKTEIITKRDNTTRFSASYF